MKQYLALTALALLAPLAAHAQAQLDRFDIKNNVIRAVNNNGGVQCGSTAAVSYTVPSTSSTIYIRFDPTPSGHDYCAENTAQPVCGTSRPTTTSSTNAWEFNPISRRLVDVNNGSSYRPNRIWVQARNSSDCVIWHYNSGMPNE
ncbi:hypothetical protein [Rhizobium sp. Nf11,1]|uniref:hypothetical protein n=1 Tax=Rhizobium sp. Nf11,1 TaxID=3404923 RepID=UPI003D32D836